MLENWISRPRPNPQARLRLFCFHTAGRGAAMFVPWAKLLPSEIELIGVQLPGRENRLREAPFTQLAPLIVELSAALLPLFERPFAFFGPSMGALVAFELARSLRQQHQLQPAHLFFASRCAPQGPDRLPPIAHLPTEAFLDAVQARYNSLPAVIRNDPELMDLFLPLLRADFQVIETYRYQPQAPFDCPMMVLRGAGDTVMHPDDFAGWRQHTTGPFTALTFPGSHFFFVEQAALVVRQIAAQLLD